MTTRLGTGKPENLKPLSSLRFFAAAMIVVWHSKLTLDFSTSISQQVAWVHGVSFFFVLSGFILTHVYLHLGTPKLLPFLQARYARLWPVHVAATVVLVTFVAADSITFDGPGLFSKWMTLALNLPLLHSLVPVPSYTFSWNSVSWSVSTEIFFYCVFPFLLPDIERNWHWKLLTAAAMSSTLILGLWLLKIPIESENINDVTATFATYPSPLMRGFEFVLGMATYVLWRKCLRDAPLSSFGMTCFELGAVFLSVWWLMHGFFQIADWITSPYVHLFLGPAASCWVFAILIAALASGRGAFGRLLSSKPLVFLGEISFSIYMFHMILIKIFVTTLQWREVPALVYASTLLALASASYFLIERPGRTFLNDMLQTKARMTSKQ